MNTTDGRMWIRDDTEWEDIFQFLGFGKGTSEMYKEADRILQVARQINGVYLWVLFAIGLPGNILTMVTIASMKICPATFFISLLAALDTTSLILKLVGQQVINNQVYIGPVGCKFEWFIPYVSTLANWMIVLICAERCITVCFKGKKPEVFSMRNAYILVAVLSAMLFLLFAGISMPMRGSISSGLYCGTFNQFVWFWVNVWYWLNAFLYMFLPAMFIIPMTALMLRKLLCSSNIGILQQNDDIGSENQASVTGRSSLTESELDNNKRGFTLAVFFAALFFVMLCLPACVFYLSYRQYDDDLTSAKWQLYQQVMFLLTDSTHAINFFLYFLPARKLRGRAFEILSCKPYRKNSYTPGQRFA
ncbi:hypothetical protein BsWGS_09313 [Bradybaena similaris]